MAVGKLLNIIGTYCGDASAITLIRDAACKGRIRNETNDIDKIGSHYRHDESPRLCCIIYMQKDPLMSCGNIRVTIHL